MCNVMQFLRVGEPDADIYELLSRNWSEIRFSKSTKEVITRKHSRGKS